MAHQGGIWCSLIMEGLRLMHIRSLCGIRAWEAQ